MSLFPFLSPSASSSRRRGGLASTSARRGGSSPCWHGHGHLKVRRRSLMLHQDNHRRRYLFRPCRCSKSPLGPKRFTDRVYQSEREAYWRLGYAINIFSVKIASSDVGFPIHVYGKVIARDNIDQKCLYLFNRDGDHSQLINSEDESLILTGPKRGILLEDAAYVEIDLKIKDRHGQKHRELSKGFFSIRGCRTSEKCTVESKSLATRLSIVDVMYAVVRRAVEATIAVEVLRGDFYGEITAYTSSIRNSLVLYDSKLAGVITCDSKGVIQLLRSVLCVRLEDMLMLSVVSWSGDGDKFECTIEFTPRVNGGDEDVVYVGATSMHVKVTWSKVY